jgi:hypothetical protein
MDRAPNFSCFGHAAATWSLACRTDWVSTRCFTLNLAVSLLGKDAMLLRIKRVVRGSSNSSLFLAKRSPAPLRAACWLQPWLVLGLLGSICCSYYLPSRSFAARPKLPFQSDGPMRECNPFSFFFCPFLSGRQEQDKDAVPEIHVVSVQIKTYYYIVLEFLLFSLFVRFIFFHVIGVATESFCSSSSSFFFFRPIFW